MNFLFFWFYFQRKSLLIEEDNPSEKIVTVKEELKSADKGRWHCKLREYGNLKVFIDDALHKKWSFPLMVSSVNVTKSAGNFTEEILNGKIHFLCSDGELEA